MIIKNFNYKSLENYAQFTEQTAESAQNRRGGRATALNRAAAEAARGHRTQDANRAGIPAEFYGKEEGEEWRLGDPVLPTCPPSTPESWRPVGEVCTCAGSPGSSCAAGQYCTDDGCLDPTKCIHMPTFTPSAAPDIIARCVQASGIPRFQKSICGKAAVIGTPKRPPCCCTPGGGYYVTPAPEPPAPTPPPPPAPSSNYCCEFACDGAEGRCGQTAAPSCQGSETKCTNCLGQWCKGPYIPPPQSGTCWDSCSDSPPHKCANCHRQLESRQCQQSRENCMGYGCWGTWCT